MRRQSPRRWRWALKRKRRYLCSPLRFGSADTKTVSETRVCAVQGGATTLWPLTERSALLVWRQEFRVVQGGRLNTERKGCVIVVASQNPFTFHVFVNDDRGVKKAGQGRLRLARPTAPRRGPPGPGPAVADPPGALGGFTPGLPQAGVHGVGELPGQHVPAVPLWCVRADERSNRSQISGRSKTDLR